MTFLPVFYTDNYGSARNGLWATNVWDFLDKVNTVLDPCLQHRSVGELHWEHDDIMDRLHQALFDWKDAWMPWLGHD